jgi:MFS family permease
MEWGDQKKRGLMGSYAQIGVPVGLILGTGGLSLLSALISPEAFDSWGWRIPFLFSLVMVAIGLWVRLKILETPMFAEVVKSKRTAKLPVIEVIKRHPKEILLAAGARFAEQMPFYIFTTFVLTYVVDEQGMSETFALNAVMCAAAIELFMLPFFSRLSDNVGRKKVYLAGVVGIGVYGFIYFGLLNTGSAALVFIAILLSLVPHDAMYGPQAALIAESFPTSLRYAGAGIGYQLASVFAGGPAPLIAVILLEKFGTAYSISAFILFACVVSYLCVHYLPDRSRSDISDDSVYARKSGAPVASAG